MSPACDAEIGRPGKWHRCGRKATLSVFRFCGVERGGYTLYYCERHADRADKRPETVARQCITKLS